MNFAKRLCSDDANLIEIVEVNACTNDSDNEFINNILKANRFEKMYRQQTEEMSANGTVGAYVRVDNADLLANGTVRGGDIKINYCDSLNIVPITVINNEIVECAFVGENKQGNEIVSVLVMFTLSDGKYINESIKFDKNGNIIENNEFQLGEVKPFSIMRTAEVNNLNMRGYGYPKLWNAIANLKVLDLSYTMWKRDLEKSDKIIMMSEKLCSRDSEGNPIPPNEQMRKIFVQIGEQEKLPEEGALWQEYNPTVRMGEVVQSFELALSLLSMSFGFGTKRYTFEQGRILTATEYAGERQDAMQEINKQRAESKNYITEIVKAIKWFSNAFYDKNFDIEEDVMIDFDDSYIEDKKTRLEMMRNDMLTLGIPTLTKWYLQKAYNLSEEEAEKLLNEQIGQDDGDGTEE